ncbi:MAG TPA: hypothetical protein VFX59_04360 [Polyangiales bacterium]|nr:hypothetical protein [Polyangiales bacterium]
MAATVEKLSLSLPLEEVAYLRDRADRERVPLSTLVLAALRESRTRKEQLARQQAAFAQYVTWATDGEGLPADVLAAAERELAEG